MTPSFLKLTTASSRRGAPSFEDGISVLVAEFAPCPGFQLEKAGPEGVQPEPASGQHAEAVSMANDERFAPCGADFGNDSIDPSAHIGGGFAIRARVGENSPIGNGFSNFRGREAFIVTVIPLGEIRGDFRRIRPTGEFASPAGSEPGAAKHETEIPLGKKWLKLGGA